MPRCARQHTPSSSGTRPDGPGAACVSRRGLRLARCPNEKSREFSAHQRSRPRRLPTNWRWWGGRLSSAQVAGTQACELTLALVCPVGQATHVGAVVAVPSTVM